MDITNKRAILGYNSVEEKIFQLFRVTGRSDPVDFLYFLSIWIESRYS